MANILSQVRSTVASWFSRQRTVLTQAFNFGTTEVYPQMDVNKVISKGFNSNTAVYSIIKKDAKKFAAVARYVENKSTNEELPGALQDLLNRPNPWQGQDAFLACVRAFYKTCGEAFIWLNRGDTAMIIDGDLVDVTDEVHALKPVLEMYVIPSNKVIVVPDPQNVFGVMGYILESNTRVPLRAVDVIHWKDINLEFDAVSKSHLRGMSALQAGYKTLEQNNSATNAAVRMYQNSGAKGVLANKTMAAMSPTQQTQLNNVMDAKINSNDVKGAVAALQGDWTYLNVGLTSVDMELLQGKDYSMKELCFLMGMPFELFDSNTTFANKEMAQKGWVINEIVPDCRQLDDEMNRVLLKAFKLEGIAEISSDFDDMPELQDDKKTQIEWLMKGPFTPNEIREATGYDPSDEDGADEIIIPSGFMKLADIAGDGGQQMLTDLYANPGTNRGNGDGQVPQD